MSDVLAAVRGYLLIVVIILIIGALERWDTHRQRRRHAQQLGRIRPRRLW